MFDYLDMCQYHGRLVTAKKEIDIAPELLELGASNCMNILQLSSDSMAHIFSFLDVPSKHMASKVCRKWQDIINIPSLWKSSCFWLAGSWPRQKSCSILSSRKIRRLDLCNLTFNEKGLAFLVDHMRHLEALTLLDCSTETVLHIHKLLRRQALPRLKELSLMDVGLGADNLINTLARNCHNLVTFKWLHYREANTKCFLRITKLLPRLETLHLRGNRHKDYIYIYQDNDSARTAQLCCLKSLTLHNIMLSELMLDMISKMPSLNELILINCKLLDLGMERLSEGIAPITALHVDGTFQGSDYIIPVSKMKTLRKISLKHSYITWRDIRRLARESSQISSLQIRVSSCLVDRSMKEVAKFSSLSELSLGPSREYVVKHITDDGLLELAKSKAPIKFLSLNGLLCITDTGLGYLSQMPHLQSVHISACDLITFKGLVDLVENESSKLSRLDVSDCCLINAQSLKDLETHPKLRCCLVLQPPLRDSAPCRNKIYKPRVNLVSPWASPSEARLWGRDVPQEDLHAWAEWLPFSNDEWMRSEHSKSQVDLELRKLFMIQD